MNPNEPCPVPRAPLACTACRRKKTKCDRSMPSCLLCAKLQNKCVYPILRLKPGPKSDPSQKLRGKPSVNESQIGYKNSSRRRYSTDCFDGNRRRSNVSDGRLPNEPSVDSDSDPSEIQPNSPETAFNFVKAIGLSSLIHPTHDLCKVSMPTGQSTMSSSGSLLSLAGAQNLLMDACDVLGVSLHQFQYLTDLYFDTMTEISLFHRPSFTHKIQNIHNPVYLQSLFAAMFAYSARFQSTDSVNALGDPQTTSNMDDPMRFHRQALALIDHSLNENPDQPPNLCLLQAMVLITFCELTKGVRGRAWRLLGSCVRVAYELHLHLIDYEAREEHFLSGRDLTRWIADEERRRCWWAIWKMDTFASVTRRCPTAIDWNMVDTYLPVSDDCWFSNQFHPSCFLEREPNDRGPALKNCGNESPDAWLVVISSIMRDAQVLLKGNLQGVLVGVDPNNNSDQLLHYFRNSFCRKITQEDSSVLKALICALHNTSTNLPQPLVYGGDILDFGFDFASGVRNHDVKRLHGVKYGIYLTLKQAQFMIYHHYAFGEIVSGTIFSPEKKNNDQASPLFSDREQSQNARGLRYCLQAADDIYGLVSRCPEDHVRHVSPFLANTVWLSASLQILRKLFGKREDLEDTLSKYAILRATCQQFTAFWRTPLTLLENLDTLETRLSRYYSSPSSSSTSSFSPTGTAIPSTAPDSMELPEIFGQTRTRTSTSSIQPDRSKNLQRRFQRALHPESLDSSFSSSRQNMSNDQSMSNSAWEGQTAVDPALDGWFSQYLSELFSETHQGGSSSSASYGQSR